MKKIFLILAAFIFLFTNSCFYNKNKFNIDKNLNINLNLIINMKKEINTTEEYISFIDEIKKIFLKENKNTLICQILGVLAENENEEIYKSINCFLLSDIYWEQGNKDISVFYMLKVNKNSYKLNYENSDIGYLIAKRVINYESNIRFKEKMYGLLFSDYLDKIDIGDTYLELSNYYKAIYEMDKAANAMSKALLYLPENDNNDEENIKENIKNELSFYKINKYWIYENLDTLIGRIKYAINEKDKKLLDQYVTPINFTIKLLQRNGLQNLSDQNWSYQELEIEKKKWSDRITFSNTLENFSNHDEAYLKTTNWDFPQISTWYLYFKRINYPFDNRINGCWEWSGIFFGEPN